MVCNTNDRPRLNLGAVWIFLIVATGIGGCASRGIVRQEYLLTSLAGTPMANPVASSAEPPTIGVGPVTLPGYLRRPQIVTRDGNRLHRSERHTWGGDLESDFARVLAENLAILVPSDRVSTFPWSDPKQLDYSVAVQVSRFDRGSDDRVSLLAQWRILDARTGETVRTGRASIREPTNGRGYDETVAAMSRAVATLGRELVEAIRARV